MDPQELIEMLLAGGEHLDRRPLPVLPNYQFNSQIPVAPIAPLGPNPQLKPGKPGEKLGEQEYIDKILTGEIDPEEGEPYQVAGDVVPMRTHPPAVSDVRMRLQSPGVGARSQGMQSIERFGKDPRSIDLLGVLEMMTGREPGR